MAGERRNNCLEGLSFQFRNWYFEEHKNETEIGQEKKKGDAAVKLK